MFRVLSSVIAMHLTTIIDVLDSSFVETYSTHDQRVPNTRGAEKERLKLHQIIDYETRLPLCQAATPGARPDVTWGERLIRRAPSSWKISGLLADKAYDSWRFVAAVHQKWNGVRVGVPVRRTHTEVVNPHDPGVTKNRRGKESDRYLRKRFLAKRTEIERYFSRKKRVFNLGEERTRHLENFRANCNLIAIMEILEWLCTDRSLVVLFTRLIHDTSLLCTRLILLHTYAFMEGATTLNPIKIYAAKATRIVCEVDDGFRTSGCGGAGVRAVRHRATV